MLNVKKEESSLIILSICFGNNAQVTHKIKKEKIYGKLQFERSCSGNKK